MGLFSKWAESLDYEYEILSSCTRHKSRHSTCLKCVDACGKGALMMNNGKPVLDKTKCDQCGDCMAACPVQAIAGILPNRKIIQNQLIISEQCFPTTTELLIYYKKGIRSIVCEEVSFIQELTCRIENANWMLKELGETPFLISTNFVEDKEHCSRREFFSLWKKESKTLMKQMTPAKWRFNQEALNLRQYFPDYQFTKITIDPEKCTFCTVCERICDKKCFTVEKGQFALSMQECSSCRICADICPEQAITIVEQISKTEEINLPVYEKKCQSCNLSFKTVRDHDATCPACTILNRFPEKGSRLR